MTFLETFKQLRCILYCTNGKGKDFC